MAVAVCAVLTTIGTDARWLAALGAAVVRTGTIPTGVPYASVASSDWHNVPVLAELIFHGLETALGDRGLILAQVVAISVALGLVAREIVAETKSASVSMVVLLLVPAAAANAFLVVRGQAFSLALFPLAVLLLRTQARAPSRQIWLLVPLTALWSNLHGAVLVGIGVAACYLLIDRLRTDPVLAIAVLVATVAAALVTPAGPDTVRYFLGVLGNAWASAHEGFWARPSYRQPLDLLFVGAALPLAVAAVRARARLWEYVAAAGLGLLVVTAARNEVWLVLFLAPLAVRGLGRGRRPSRPMPLAFAVSILVAAAGLVFALARPPTQLAAGPALSREAIAAAGGTPILADPYDGEQLALQGATIVIGNPIDAFDRRAQQLYLEWIQGSPTAANELAPTAHVALVVRGTAAQRRLARDPAFCEAAADSQSILYLRREHRPCGGTSA
ncbi:MAG TPA: hypothetical protein VLN26_02910 [Gaiellaceae bacterium]|nr:hypothetical protein [Gaiellaceae bacterium]